MTENMSSFQISPHNNSSSFGRRHSLEPSMRFDSFAFFGSWKSISDVCSDCNCRPSWN